jgi:hypothetical protein
MYREGMTEHMSLDLGVSSDKVGAVRVSFVRTAMEHIANVALQPSVDGAVAALRQLFRVEVAYATRHNATHQILEAVAGDGSSFGIADGEAIPREDTYYQRILDGELLSILRDVRADPVAVAMAMTEDADVGAFASGRSSCRTALSTARFVAGATSDSYVGMRAMCGSCM